MQSIVLSQAPSIGELSYAEFNLSFADLPNDFVESFFSSPSVECNGLEELDFHTFSDLFDDEKVLAHPLVDGSSSPTSSVATEPLCDNDQVYKLITELIQQEEKPALVTPTHPRKRTATVYDEEYEILHARRRKTQHAHLYEDEEDSFSTSASSYKSLDSSADSFQGKNGQRKRLSNREAAHRYRQKMKMRSEHMNRELEESFRSMNRAKQAYEKAAEALRVLQRVVKDLTVSCS